MDDAAAILKLRCPEHYVKLWFDEDTGEFYCPHCSYCLKKVDVDADLL